MRRVRESVYIHWVIIVSGGEEDEEEEIDDCASLLIIIQELSLRPVPRSTHTISAVFLIY
jgi:hypothetical protein